MQSDVLAEAATGEKSGIVYMNGSDRVDEKNKR